MVRPDTILRNELMLNVTRDAVRSARASARWLGASERPLPDFLIIGAQRCGTTSLFQNLRKHPQVVEPITKEVQFFTMFHGLGERWYRSHFPRLQHGQQTFEASPYYFFHPDVPPLVTSMLPIAKLVVLLRDPVARAYSHYLHSRNLGVETLTFEDALEAEPLRLEAAFNKGLHTRAGRHLHSHFSYASRGLYASQLERWRAHVPPGRLKVVKSEDLNENPSKGYGELLDYLGLEPFTVDEFTRSNVLTNGERIALDTEDRLREFFVADSARLSAMVGWGATWQ
jgi:hypothetical protein